MRNDEFDKSYKFRFVTAVRRGAISEKYFLIPTAVADCGRQGIQMPP